MIWKQHVSICNLYMYNILCCTILATYITVQYYTEITFVISAVYNLLGLNKRYLWNCVFLEIRKVHLNLFCFWTSG